MRKRVHDERKKDLILANAYGNQVWPCSAFGFVWTTRVPLRGHRDLVAYMAARTSEGGRSRSTCVESRFRQYKDAVALSLSNARQVEIGPFLRQY